MAYTLTLIYIVAAIVAIAADPIEDMRKALCDGTPETKEKGIQCMKDASEVLWKVFQECTAQNGGEDWCPNAKAVKKCGYARQAEIISGSNMSKLLGIPKCTKAAAKG